MAKMRPENGLFKLSKTILTDRCKVEEKNLLRELRNSYVL